MIAQDQGELDHAERWYRKSLDIREQLDNRPGMASSYHQLGIIAQLRGELDEAERWYRPSLDINEQLGNRPSMAMTYAQLGLLTEERGDLAGALRWTVRSVSLFNAFPHRATGTAPRQMIRLTGRLGFEVLHTVWQEITGTEIPESITTAIRSVLDDEKEP
jgi:tetratricopeptide (TPR) repeat protein